MDKMIAVEMVAVGGWVCAYVCELACDSTMLESL